MQLISSYDPDLRYLLVNVDFTLILAVVNHTGVMTDFSLIVKDWYCVPLSTGLLIKY